MFAVVEVGGNQFKVSVGDTIEANRLADEVGKSITLDQVLLFANDKDVRVGKPYLKDVKVEAKVLEQTLADKVIAFKYRRRKDSSSKIGHRQKLTALNITNISA